MTTITQFSLFKGVEKKATKHKEPVDYEEMERVGRFIHLGAGLQSSTLVEMAVEGEIENVDGVIFCDTKDEPAYVYDQVEYLKGRCNEAGISLHVIEKSEGGIIGDLQNGSGRFASMPVFTRDPESGKVGRLRRQCTQEYKITPAKNFMLDWLVDRQYASIHDTKQGSRRVLRRRDIYVEALFGISLDEFERANNRGPNWQKAEYPLIDRRMTRQDCAEWLRARGLPVAKKSSCRVCPYHSNDYWKFLKAQRPDDFEAACKFDDWLRTADAERLTMGLSSTVYLHRSCQPLRDVDFDALLTTNGQAELSEFCGGHCMV